MDRKPLVSVTKKDFTITTFRGSGAGGQKRNKTDSGVRIFHADSGAVAQDCSTPSQLSNKRTAFKRLVKDPIFVTWLKKKTAEASLSDSERRMKEEAIGRKVDRSMREENLKVEFYEPGK